MLTNFTYPNAPAVSEELGLYKREARLTTINAVRGLGILREYDGSTDALWLNQGAATSLVEPFVSSQEFSAARQWFAAVSEELLGKRFFMAGAVGLTPAGGSFSYLHGDGVQQRLVVAFSDDPNINPSTMIYTGDPLDIDPRTEPTMEVVIRDLGMDVFEQPTMGQVGSFGNRQRHGEPPLPEATARLFMSSAVQA